MRGRKSCPANSARPPPPGGLRPPPSPARGEGRLKLGTMSEFAEILDRLVGTIAARKGADPASSYTAKLLSEGPERCAKKFGEEAVETVIASAAGDKDA